MQAALKPLFEGWTTIAIAHRLSRVLAADQILVIGGGRLVERGGHLELLARGGLDAERYVRQFQRRGTGQHAARGIVRRRGDARRGGDPAATALVAAIRGGDLEALERLLGQRPELASVRIADAKGVLRTPPHIATDWPGHSPTLLRSSAC